MTFTINRESEVDSLGVPGITGTLSTPDGFSCLTLEGKLTLCPTGTYKLIRGFMETHQVYRAELVDVPGHTGVFIHSGEKASDSRMCPLVGDSRPTPGTLAGGQLHHVADQIAMMVGEYPSTLTIIDIPKEPEIA